MSKGVRTKTVFKTFCTMQVSGKQGNKIEIEKKNIKENTSFFRQIYCLLSTHYFYQVMNTLSEKKK